MLVKFILGQIKIFVGLVRNFFWPCLNCSQLELFNTICKVRLTCCFSLVRAFIMISYFVPDQGHYSLRSIFSSPKHYLNTGKII